MSKEQWRWLQTGAVRDTESGFFDQEGDLQISPFLKKKAHPCGSTSPEPNVLGWRFLGKGIE